MVGLSVERGAENDSPLLSPFAPFSVREGRKTITLGPAYSRSPVHSGDKKKNTVCLWIESGERPASPSVRQSVSPMWILAFREMEREKGGDGSGGGGIATKREQTQSGEGRMCERTKQRKASYNNWVSPRTYSCKPNLTHIEGVGNLAGT